VPLGRERPAASLVGDVFCGFGGRGRGMRMRMGMGMVERGWWKVEIGRRER